jgi:hypothetical protein
MVTVTKPVSVKGYVIRQLDVTTAWKNSTFFLKSPPFSKNFKIIGSIIYAKFKK